MIGLSLSHLDTYLHVIANQKDDQVCTYIVYIYNVYTYVCMYVFIVHKYVHMYVCMYIYVCMYARTYMHACIVLLKYTALHVTIV